MHAFEEFLAKIDRPEHRAEMEEVLAWVADTFPQLKPKIAWNQPMFTDHDTFIVGFSASKGHFAIAPEEATMNRFLDEIVQSKHDHTKGLIRFKWGQPVDFPLLERMIAFNIEDKADCTTFWRK
ncbi:iron chaperone [Paenibacillus albicereus]|uniref:Iron chaperone n=1 Tax=Paenibacillus albicereus TaxID=2726185 RepID=A0A6H2GXG7_9BACL|nr:iron chaperone [Paenibacillus albicereus]QJC52082.1 iron chaperone [Paenibacillus albicereus]